MADQVELSEFQGDSITLDIISPLGSKLVEVGCFGGLLGTLLFFLSGNDDVLGWHIPYGFTIGVIVVTVLCITLLNYLEEKIVLDFVGQSVKFHRRLFGVGLQTRRMANFADLKSVVLQPLRVPQIGEPPNWCYGTSLLTNKGVLIPLRAPFSEDYEGECEQATIFANLLGIAVEAAKPKTVLKVRTQLGAVAVNYDPHPDDRYRQQDS